MKKIKLTKGKFALVDDEDFEYLNQWKWHFMNRYAYHSFKQVDGSWKEISMHVILMKTPKDKETDHINRNGLDNQRHNLRIVTVSQNQHNTDKTVKNTSGFKGVTYHKRDKYWQASIRKDGKRIYLGSYKNIEHAAIAYQQAERGIL